MGTSCGCLEGVLEASWKRLGASSKIYSGLGHGIYGIAFTVDFEKDFRQYERRLVLGFQEETRQPYIMLCISV